VADGRESLFEDSDLIALRTFAEGLSDDLGPMFGRDVVRLVDDYYRLREALDDISSGQWQRYPTRSMHGCITVQEYARYEAAGGQRA
jgi:hypothetical protein